MQFRSTVSVSIRLIGIVGYWNAQYEMTAAATISEKVTCNE